MEKGSLLSVIESYSTNKCREAEYSEQINSRVFVDSNTHDTQPKTVRRAYSKVEKKGIDLYLVNKKLEVARREIEKVENYIEHSGLTDQEKAVLWLIARRKKMLPYAREHGIASSTIYKIRDKALKKVMKKHKMRYF